MGRQGAKTLSGQETLLLTETEVKTLLSMKEAIGVVENAFKEKAEGKVQMPPKVYVFFPAYQGDFRVMPAYLEKSNVSGVKVVNVHPGNPRSFGLPSVMATITLIDPETGFPLCIMDGTWLTAVRTGAAGGVAVKHLSKEDSNTVGIVGAGVQARTQLLAINEVREISSVKVADILEDARKRYVKEVSQMMDVDIVAVNRVEEAARDSDILVTATPARKPLVMNEWISNGTHINAIGADAPGKQELDPKILKMGKIVVDDYEQAIHSGGIDFAISKGIITRDMIHAELGEVVVGKKTGRTSREEVTIFNSTGLAIQDIATASIVYQRAKKKNVGRWIKFRS